VIPVELKQIIKRIREYNPKADLEIVNKAYSYAEAAHKGQKRKSGDNFVVHPIEVAYILAQLQLDEVTIAAGLLHDVVEDTDITLADLEAEFGQEVAALVDGVTKLSRIAYKSKEEQQVENLRKMFLAMARDIRVILIKLADRLHNMRTLKHQPIPKQKEIAEETLEIFAPLAHRLGIFKIKWELEDLAFRYHHPESYYQLVKRISMKRKTRETFINSFMEKLQEKAVEMEIPVDIQGRPKHFYSIYNKMVRQEKDINEIYDLIAIRIVVDNIRDCYAVLGMIHSLWKPIPGRFKDYIAMPKPNMYQSLHTTVIGPQGEPVEIQIRTWEMHSTAEYGIAAHWRYKENQAGDQDFEKKLSWLRQILEWQQDSGDAREFMESLKIDLFSDRVYVFTPKGDVIEFPAGSVPIDFAYRVHTAVGHQCIGAKVSGRIVPLDYKLKTGDIVEILTAKGSGPSRDWLSLVQTSQAKNRIRSWFKKGKREENLLKGKEMLEREVRKAGQPISEVMKSEHLLEAAKKYNIGSVDDLYAAMGDGGITPLQVLRHLKELFPLKEVQEKQPVVKPWDGYGKASQGVRVRGVENLMVRLGRCCNPLPGDDIVGYITRGRGVSIHRGDCPNIIHAQQNEKERLVDVAWDNEEETVFQVQLEALALDRPRLAMDIMNTIAETKTVINSVHARAKRNNLAVVDLKIEIRSMEHLHYLMEKVRRLRDVLEVKRITPKQDQKG